MREGAALINRLWIDSNGSARSEPPEEFDEFQYSACLWLDGTEITRNADQMRSSNFFMLGHSRQHYRLKNRPRCRRSTRSCSSKFLSANCEMFAEGSNAVVSHDEQLPQTEVIGDSTVSASANRPTDHSIRGESVPFSLTKNLLAVLLWTCENRSNDASLRALFNKSRPSQPAQ